MKKLVIKYLNDSISDSEYQELLLLLRKPKNKQKFTELVKENCNVNIAYEEIDEELALNKVKTAINRSKAAPKRYVWKYTVAATIAIMLTCGYIFRDIIFNNVTSLDNNPRMVNTPTPGIDKAVLTLEDGTEVVLENGVIYESNYATSKGQEIVYNAIKESEEIVYNYLTIPRGGQYRIELSDGTQVWLNSETKLKYPVSFIDGKVREVELVYGEAYFDVSSSILHKGSKFKVFTKDQEIEVLGTEFNVKAYMDENYIYTTLVEGKVALNTSNLRELLKPNQQATFSLIDDDITVEEVDVYYETAWKKGMFAFKNKTLKEIMKVLSRWYDVDVVFEDKTLEDVQFKGVVNKNQNMDLILTLIKNTKYIKAYEIKNNTIILKN
ncbi:DUF4974 domain-containing protein [Aestuariibaculum sp. M13]|uniref:FecR family protein n=1 Tax=Aestuariibaculum sp. M13 TaxID=2967132 RepID=UPI002159E5AE|nr:FecR domain-containing protein [Aestuariibaculum sp. M13]MCR8668939.1 DUF4974 domain-containing protein [Aestuariibaculum sp. M13]